MRQENRNNQTTFREENMPAPKLAEEKIVAEEKEKKDRMTVYVNKQIAKKFKIFAIEEEKDYSELAELAFVQFLENHQKIKS